LSKPKFIRSCRAEEEEEEEEEENTRLVQPFQHTYVPTNDTQDRSLAVQCVPYVEEIVLVVTYIREKES
jgi:hypothetical protein